MKINIKAFLKNKDKIHKFEGKGIKNKNQIIYKDENILTKIKMDNVITIERKSEYIIIMNLKKGIKLKGKYITKYGLIKLETYAHEVKKTKNEIKIKYDLFLNDEYVGTFTYNCEYSIDT